MSFYTIFRIQQLLATDSKARKKAKAEGYAEGTTLLYSQLMASAFIGGSDHIDELASASVVLNVYFYISKSLDTEIVDFYWLATMICCD